MRSTKCWTVRASGRRRRSASSCRAAACRRRKHVSSWTKFYSVQRDGDSSADPNSDEDDFPAPLDEIAFHGLAGDIVRRIEPHTEADRSGLLIHISLGFGSAVNRCPHAVADGSRHGVNIFAVSLARLSKARKGTSAAHIKRIIRRSDEAWGRECVTSGLSSGEGLIYDVRTR